mgnify:FL=1
MMTQDGYDIAVSLDLTGLKCPLPVLKARRQITRMQDGVVEVLADDPAAPLDFEHFCDTSGHMLIRNADEGGIFTFHIRVRGAPAGQADTAD